MQTATTLAALLLSAVLTGCATLHAEPPRTPQQAPPRGDQLLEISDLLAASGEHVRAGQYLVLAQQQGVSELAVLPRLLKLYIADGQYRLAIEHAEQFLRRHPSDTRLRLCLASLYAAVDLDTQAIRELERVVAAEPHNAEAHFALASLLLAAGTERAATDQHYRAYLTLEPKGQHAEEARAGLLQDVP